MEEQFKMPAILWLECLPEEMRNKAIYNCLVQGRLSELFKLRRSLSGSISYGFVWSKTNEGTDYWFSVFSFYESLEK